MNVYDTRMTSRQITNTSITRFHEDWQLFLKYSTHTSRKDKVSEQTIYTWRRRFDERQPIDIKRLRQLEAENAKLKKLVAERDLETETMKEISR